MGKEPLFKVGDHVVQRSDRSQHGHVTAEPLLDAGDYWYRVRFDRRVVELIEDNLDAVPDPELEPSDLAERGQWGKLEALRRVLAVERISRRNRSTVYAFNAQRIIFQPYQYKPLLRFLDSPDRRLLIADEVGLGKTIEAGLVLTELQARENLEKILVICPSRLRQKWREELNRKFGQDFDILDRAGVKAYLQRVRERPDRARLRGIVSIQAFRSTDLFEEFAAEVESVDLVIVDEAHHARNPGTLTSDMLHMIGDQVGQAVLLLTATPLHLGSENLFNLLSALRPSEFRNAQLFDEELRRNRGVLTAMARVRSRNADQLPEAAREIESVFSTLQGVQDPVAARVVQSLRSEPPMSSRQWVELERSVEDCHLLATILTRTRKRDVQEHAPTRRPRVWTVRWSDEEHRLYEELLGPSCSGGWPRESLDLGQIQRARQAASCLTAAYHHYSARQEDQDVSDLSDVDPEDLGFRVERGSGNQPVAPSALPNRDSKLDVLLGILKEIEEAEPDAKILIFTFFVGTSLYLQEQLQSRGWKSLRIAGDVPSTPNRPETDQRGRIVDQFRTDPSARVLVSTEVGSEGLDFQFAHHVVNYDLPWNPMVVEQRIGRVDRFGQTSDVVYIHSLIVEGTIEDRILRRLYDRIQIFERSIGSLEAILGDAVRNLQRDYFTGRLTPEEAERRVDEAARAIANRELELENLEREAGTLFGHEEFIRDEMARVRRLGRYLSPRALMTLLEGYLAAHHPRVALRHEEPHVFSLPVDAELLGAVQDQAPTGSIIAQLQLRARGGRIRFTTDGEVAFRRPELELLNASHPLVLAAVEGMTPALDDALARLGAGTLRLEVGAEDGLRAGLVHIAVFAQEVTGVKERTILDCVAWCERTQELLDSDVAERLLHLALEQGAEWERSDPPPPLPGPAWRRMVSDVRSRNRELQGREQQDNDARYLRRKRVIESERDHRTRIVEQKLGTARSSGRGRRILNLFEAQLVHVNTRFRKQLRELDDRREVGVALCGPLAICVVEVRE